MPKLARIDENNVVLEPLMDWIGDPPQFADLHFVEVPENQGGVTQGWTYNPETKAFAAPAPVAPASVPQPTTRYVQVASIRERLEAKNKWPEFAQLLEQIPADKKWRLLTLREGVASDDPDAIQLIEGVGENPTEILAA